MITCLRYFPPTLLLLLFLTGCGYHNPNIYNGPDQVIFLNNWKNRTNDLSLDARFYQNLYRWYQRSGSITVTRDKEVADLVLAGEVISISLPSRSYDSSNSATEVRVSIKVRYVLQDRATGAILVEQPSETWSETYLVGTTTSITNTNQQEAITTIVDDISEGIYQKTLKVLKDR